jgi:polyhydroxyalkanoate synthase
MDADEWLKRAPLFEGSWWPAWQHWLAEHSGSKQLPARTPTVRGHKGAATLADAPGEYVLG